MLKNSFKRNVNKKNRYDICITFKKTVLLLQKFRLRHSTKIKIRIRNEHPGSYFRELGNNFLGYNTIHKFFDANAGFGNLFDPGSGKEKIRIRDKHPGSATLSVKVVGVSQHNNSLSITRLVPFGAA